MRHKKKGINKKRVVFEISLTLDKLECKAKKKGRRIVQGISTFLWVYPMLEKGTSTENLAVKICQPSKGGTRKIARELAQKP